MGLDLSSLSELPEACVSGKGSFQPESKCKHAMQAASGRSDLGGSSLICAFNAYLLSIYCVLKTVLGAGNTASSEVDEVSVVVKLSLYRREISNNQTNKKGHLEILDSDTVNEKKNTQKHSHMIVAERERENSPL